MRYFLLMLCLVVFAACGGEENNGVVDPNNGAKEAECEEAADCADNMVATYLDPTKLECTPDVNGINYCSECINNRDCPEGHQCREKRYCEELAPCNVGSDCADPAAELHLSCQAGLCKFCDDDFQCDVDNGEICYNRLCASIEAVQESCRDTPITCEGACPVQYDDNDNAISVMCVE